MPRHNGASGGRSGKRRRPQAQRGAKASSPVGSTLIRRDGLVQRKPSARPKLLPMVEADGFCPTGKIRYATADDAKEALARAHYNRQILKSEIIEERYYPEPGDRGCVCGGFHLTSQPKRAR